MKTFHSYCFLFFILVSVKALAQENKIKLHSINTFGVAIGETGGATLFQSINGLRFNRWFSGIGIGADYYRYKSYPLFIDTRRYLGERKNAFAYGNIGYNFSGKNKPGKEIFYYDSYNFSGGIYTDIGMGYRTPFIKQSSFLISAGYCYKEIKNKVGIVNPCLVAPCPVEYSTYNYNFGTIVLKAGIDF